MKNFFAFLFMVSAFSHSYAQTTTSSIKGVVKNNNLELLPSSNVVAIHVPTGSKYSAIASFDGRFNILNMRIGGPYKITVSFLGY